MTQLLSNSGYHCCRYINKCKYKANIGQDLVMTFMLSASAVIDYLKVLLVL